MFGDCEHTLAASLWLARPLHHFTGAIDTIAKLVEFYNSRRIHHTLSYDMSEEWYMSGIAEAE
mgnify:CR=1 FL=1